MYSPGDSQTWLGAAAGEEVPSPKSHQLPSAGGEARPLRITGWPADGLGGRASIPRVGAPAARASQAAARPRTGTARKRKGRRTAA